MMYVACQRRPALSAPRRLRGAGSILAALFASLVVLLPAAGIGADDANPKVHVATAEQVALAPPELATDEPSPNSNPTQPELVSPESAAEETSNEESEAESAEVCSADATKDDATSEDARLDPATEHEIWAISSRQIGCPSEDLSGLQYFRREEDQWVPREAAAFHQTGSEADLTVVFVHGNRTNFQWASRRGLQTYANFVADGASSQRVRYVIWAWPSDRVRGPIKDFRIKANRAKLEGILFGSFLQTLPQDRRLSLIGYSYGSRIVLGGVHLMSGQPLYGRRLNLPEGFRPPPIRVALIAAAANNTSLLPQSPYGQAYPLMERLLLINNSADRALRLYRWIEPRHKISALGNTGLVGKRALDDQGTRVSQFDFARQIGCDHSLELYFRSAQIRDLMQQQLFWFADEFQSSQVAHSGSPSR